MEYKFKKYSAHDILKSHNFSWEPVFMKKHKSDSVDLFYNIFYWK